MSNDFKIKGVKIAKLPSDYGSTGFKMFKGGVLNNVEIAYETWGELSINNDNAILIFTGLSPSSHAAASETNRPAASEPRSRVPSACPSDHLFRHAC